MVRKPEGQSKALDCLQLGEGAAFSTHPVPFHGICNPASCLGQKHTENTGVAHQGLERERFSL